MNPPTSGQKWNIPELSRNIPVLPNGVSLKTLIGTVAADNNTPATQSMSVHLYHLKESEEDPQAPHEQEELYYVISGSRTLIVDDESNSQKSVELTEGDLVYVPAKANHKFEGPGEIKLLVLFAPSWNGKPAQSNHAPD